MKKFVGVWLVVARWHCGVVKAMTACANIPPGISSANHKKRVVYFVAGPCFGHGLYIDRRLMFGQF